MCPEPGSPARRRYRRAAPAVPCADDHSRPAGPHDAAVSGVDSGRAHAQRADCQSGRAEDPGGRPDGCAGGATASTCMRFTSMFRREHRRSTPPSISSRRRRKAATRRELRPRASWRCSTGTRCCCIPRARRPTACNTRPRCACPNSWRYGTALPIARESGNEIEFQPAPLTTLIDSPVSAGAHFRTIELGTDRGAPHYLHLAGDSDRALEMSPELGGRVQEPGGGSGRAVRLAPLPGLSFPVHAQRPRGALRPGAPRIERRPPGRAHPGRSRPAKALRRACCRTSSCTPGTANTAGPPGSSRAAPMAATIRR